MAGCIAPAEAANPPRRQKTPHWPREGMPAYRVLHNRTFRGGTRLAALPTGTKAGNPSENRPRGVPANCTRCTCFSPWARPRPHRKNHKTVLLPHQSGNTSSLRSALSASAGYGSRERRRFSRQPIVIKALAFPSVTLVPAAPTVTERPGRDEAPGRRERDGGDMSGENPSKVQYLTVADVAACLNVSRMTVYRLVRSGAMPAARFGRSFRVSQNAVDQYLHDAELPGPGTGDRAGHGVRQARG